mgnify:FL=1
MYPSLLRRALGHLFAFCQNEGTHAVQSYLLLFSSIFLNCDKSQADEIGSNRSPSTSPASSISEIRLPLSLHRDVPLCPFTIPDGILFRPTAYPIVRGERYAWEGTTEQLKDVRRCISMLVDSIGLLTTWGVAFIIQHLMLLLGNTSLPRDILKHHFFCLIYTNSSVLIHHVLLLLYRFPECFQALDHLIVIDNILYLMDEPKLYVLSL